MIKLFVFFEFLKQKESIQAKPGNSSLKFFA